MFADWLSLPQHVPSVSVVRTADALKGLGREFNISAEELPPTPPDADLLQQTDAGEGLIIASRTLGGADLKYSQQVRFRGAGEVRACLHTLHLCARQRRFAFLDSALWTARSTHAASRWKLFHFLLHGWPMSVGQLLEAGSSLVLADPKTYFELLLCAAVVFEFNQCWFLRRPSRSSTRCTARPPTCLACCSPSGRWCDSE